MSLRIGITCYPTFGGSGIIATEVGLALAAAGHRVHFICSDLPIRLDPDLPNVYFHRVNAVDYHVFPHVPYALALTSRMVAVARSEGLDLLHAHYAVPHATSAWMAREVLGAGAPKLVTTLHGTDITLVGSDEAYLPITRHSIAQSDGLSAPSVFLRDETWARFDLDPTQTPIDVIPNFVDTAHYRPPAAPDRPELVRLFGARARDLPVVVHTSNFRPVKRVDWVVDAFAKVLEQGPALLLLIGDGPDKPAVKAQLEALQIADRAVLVGGEVDVASLVRECDTFLLPSTTESFGLAALEALASGVPVVASHVGGLPEVILPDRTGFLVDPNDLPGHAARTAQILFDPTRRRAMGEAARQDAVVRFQAAPVVDQYLALYERVLSR